MDKQETEERSTHIFTLKSSYISTVNQYANIITGTPNMGGCPTMIVLLSSELA